MSVHGEPANAIALRRSMIGRVVGFRRDDREVQGGVEVTGRTQCQPTDQRMEI